MTTGTVSGSVGGKKDGKDINDEKDFILYAAWTEMFATLHPTSKRLIHDRVRYKGPAEIWSGRHMERLMFW